MTSSINTKILFYIMQNADIFTYVEYWHGEFKFKYNNDKDWADEIDKKMTSKYIKKNFPNCVKIASGNYNDDYDSDYDNDELKDLYVDEFMKLKELLIKLYPILKFTAEGSMVDHLDEIIEIIARHVDKM